MKPARASAIAFCAALILGSGAVRAAELTVLVAGATRAAMQQIAPEFAAAGGDRLKIESATAGGVEKQVEAGAPIDVAITTRPRLDKLVHEGKIAAGAAAVLARAEIGAAVRQGAPRPEIASVASFKQALLAAKSIAYTDPASGGTSGIHLAKVLERLGIAEAIKGKTRLVTAQPGEGSPSVGAAVARGDAELGLQPISELLGVPGVAVVGPIPAELQSPDLVYGAGVPAAAAQPEAARRLIAFLQGPAALAAFKAHGLAPE